MGQAAAEMTKSFITYEATKKLKALGESAIDLSKEAVLSADRIQEYTVEACGFKLLFGTERVDQAVIDALCDLARESEAVQKMHAMQSGEVINTIEGYPSEDREVLHTAMRDLFDSHNPSEKARAASSFASQEHAKLKAFIERIDDQDAFENLIMVGIGGSDLGPQALHMALPAYHKKGRRTFFLSNVDPDHQAMILNDLDLSKTLAVVVSKSGTTIETLTNETILREKFKQANLNPDRHFAAVTGKGSPMDDPKRYLESFYMRDYVGGRYSATSMVGGVMLSFALGYETYLEMLRGAHEMDKHALEEDPRKNLPLFSALLGVWNRNFLGHSTIAVIPYSQPLSRLAAHLQQVDMESNGKSIDKSGQRVSYDTGPIVFGEPGTNGQHSFFQHLHQGTTVVPFEFIGFRDCHFQDDLDVQGTLSQQKLLANLFAQSLALATGKSDQNPNKHFSGNRPNHILMGEQLTPLTLGALFSYFEHKVAFQGFIWGINSFDQEGVQLGKVLAEKILGLYRGDKTSYPLGQALIDITQTFPTWGK